MTLLVANLDAEVEWADAAPLPAAVRARIAALGTLLRALGDDGDVLELVAPVDPARMTDAGPRPRLIARDAAAPIASHGRLAPPLPAWSGPDAPPVLAWGATAAHPASGDVAIARRANDRRLAHAIATQLGAVPDGVAIVESIDELAARLPAACVASPTGAWVAKATICAAGRDRVRRRGAELDVATRVRLERLLARGGALVLEPWLDRSADLGQPGRVHEDGSIVLVAPHRLHCDDHGGFRGIAIGDDPVVAEHAGALEAAGGAAGAALAALGYRGPFVVDGFVHGDRRLRPVVEINARLTFGWIARAWAERLGPGALALGDGAPPPGTIALLLPGRTDPTAAWWVSAS